MSLFKSAFIFGLALMGMRAVAKPEASASYEMEGNVERKALRPDGEWVFMTNSFQLFVAGCRSAIRVGSNGDKSVDYMEYVCDGTNSELVIKYLPPEVLESAGVGDGGHKRAINQASVTINSGMVPEYGFGMITPVWVACASSCFFHKAGNTIEPIFCIDPGLQGYHLKVMASWSLSAQNPKLPEWMTDFTDGNAYEWENGDLRPERLAKPFDKPTTNAIFSVLSWTKLGDLHLPSKWQVVYYRPNLTTGALDVRIVDTAYTTAVRNGTSRESFAIQAPEYSRIVDCTLEAQGVPVHAYAYISTNGDILPLSEMRQQRNFAQILKEGQKRVQVPKKRSPLVMVVLTLCFAAAAVVLWGWRSEERT